MSVQHGAPARRDTSVLKVRVRHARAAIALLAIFAAPGTFATPAADAGLPSAIEYQIKASFVYTVAKFVDWPETAFDGPGTPMTFGILGNDAVADAISSALQGKRVHDRELRVKRLSGVGAVRDCQILYISEGEARSIDAVLDQVAAASILTVGESRDFAAAGGILGLSMQENLVQFEVNMAAAQRARISISSKILRLGRVLKDGGAAGEGRP